MSDWGVPDWLRPAQYPTHTTGVAWAWEFLRRSPAYRAFWTEDVLPFVGADGSIDADASMGKYQSIDADGEHEWGVYKEAQDRFGLMAGPRDPRSPTRPFMTGRATREVTAGRWNPEVRLKLSRGQVAYVFDLECPLEPQFRDALRFAKALQTHQRKKGEAANYDGRLRPEKYVLYLRLIDGEDAGAERIWIRDELFAHIPEEYPSHARTAAFKNTRTAAHRLRDGGYRSLAAA